MAAEAADNLETYADMFDPEDEEHHRLTALAVQLEDAVARFMEVRGE